MHKLRSWSMLLVLALLFSCNFTEELYLEADGSGKISINFDGSELMEMAGDQMAGAAEKRMDSIISFKSFLEEKKDSIALLSLDEQERLKKLEPFNMHIVMDPATKEMKFEMYSEFQDVNEVSDAFNTFQEASSTLGPGSKQQESPMGMGREQGTEVSYSFEAGTFVRNTKIIDSTLMLQSLDSLKGAEMFLAQSTYTLKYHFPRRIKSTSAKTATYSADGKTLFYEVAFMDYMNNPDTLNIEVLLEP